MLTLILVCIVILLLIGVIVGFYIFYTKNLVFTDILLNQTNTASLSIEATSNNLSEIKDQVSPENIKSIVTDAIKTEMERLAAEQEPEEGDEQVDLTTFIQESIVTAFQEHVFNEQNIKDIQALLTDTINEVLSKNPLTQMMAQGSELTEEQLKNVEENAGAVMVNVISEINPMLPELLKKGMGDDWQKTITENPQTSMALITFLQQRGFLNWAESLGGLINPVGAVGTTTNKPQIKTTAARY